MVQGNVKIFQFGSFIIDGERQQLFKDGIPTSIQRKLYEILLLLIENEGDLVTKEQLIESVWQGREIDERNLTQHIYNLRRVLGDNPRNPSFILTIPGKGYTFSHPVRQLELEEMEAILNQSPSSKNGLTNRSRVGLSGILNLHPFRLIGRAFRSWKFLAALGIGLLLVALMLMVHPSWRGKSGSEPATYPSILTLPTISGFKTDPGFSPDGQQIVFSSVQSGKSLDIFVSSAMPSAARSLIQLSNHPLSEHSPAWSPDGQSIAFLRGDQYDQRKIDLVVVPSTGGAERTVAKVWGGVDWSPDGRYLAVIDEDDPDTPSTVFLISRDGTERRRLTDPVPGEWRFDSTPRYSPDGKSIAFIRWRGDLDGDIWIVDIETKMLRQFTADRLLIADLRWSADGSEILFVSGRRTGVERLWRQRIDEKVPVLIESMVSDIHRFDVHPFQPRLVFTQYSQNTSIEIWPVGPAYANGRLSGNRPRQGWVCRIDANTGNMQSRYTGETKRVISTSNSRNFLNPRFSPDGKRLLFVSNQTGTNQLWLANADCSDPAQLTRLDFEGVGSPRWSPDGRRIAFDGRRSGPADVFVMDADGNNLQQLTEGYMPSWSADGRYIYYVSNRRRMPQIWKIPVAGGAAIKVTETHSRDPLESPDGRVLYFTNVDRLWQKNLASGLESAVPGIEDRAISRYWDLTPGKIYFGVSTDKSDRFQLNYLDLQTGRVELLLELSGIMAKWVPGITVKPGDQLLGVSYLNNILGDIQLLDNWR
jgi:Tol biopolymer transport system component/DNA-binding winged helix-turn-helix (wHTH) protein